MLTHARIHNCNISADRAFHLQLDQPVHLHRVFHRQFLDQRLDKAAHDHGRGFVLADATALQVEELLLADLADRGFVADADVVFLDLDVGIGVGAAAFVQQQRVADDVALAVMGALGHPQQAAIGGAAAILGDRLGDDLGAGVGRAVHDLAAGVLVLALAGKGDRQNLAVRLGAEHVDRRVLHRHLAAQVAVDPLHGGAFVGDGALGHQVVDVGAPVLDRRVAAAGALLDDDLDHRAVQAVARIDRRGAAFHIVHAGAFFDDDQRALELAHVLGVDAEVGLQRDVHMDALGHVDEAAAAPHRAVERGKLVVGRRDDGGEVLAHDVLVLAQAAVHVQEDDAELFPLLRAGCGRPLRSRTGRRRRPGTCVRPRECPGGRRCA